MKKKIVTLVSLKWVVFASLLFSRLCLHCGPIILYLRVPVDHGCI